MRKLCRRRTFVVVKLIVLVVALALTPTASARTFVAMKNASLVAKTYQRYLNAHGFRQHCRQCPPLSGGFQRYHSGERPCWQGWLQAARYAETARLSLQGRRDSTPDLRFLRLSRNRITVRVQAACATFCATVGTACHRSDSSAAEQTFQRRSLGARPRAEGDGSVVESRVDPGKERRGAG